jgi:AcrR family transcriptional regulator
MARTRSASAHKKVLEAAIAVVAERGVDATSMDEIARQSGVSKATIYKHWSDKEALLLEMLAEVTGLHARPDFNSGDLWADMVAVLSYHPEENAQQRERIMPHLIAYSAAHKEFGLTWRNMVMEPPRRELKGLMKAAIARGELPPKLDFELALALLLGPIIYSKVFLPRDCRDTKPLARGVVEAFRRAFGVSTKPRAKSR